MREKYNFWGARKLKVRENKRDDLKIKKLELTEDGKDGKIKVSGKKEVTEENSV